MLSAQWFRCRPFLLVWSLLVALPWSTSFAQGGYTTERHRQAGMDFPVPRRYTSVPVQPTEEWIRFRFQEAAEETKQRGRKSRPELYIADLPYVPDLAPTTGDVAEAAPEGSGEDAEPKDEASEVKAVPKVLLPVSTFERFLERRFRGWTATPIDGSASTRREWEGQAFQLESKGSGKSQRFGWAWVWRQSRVREVAFVGFCHEDDLVEQSRIWRHMADEIKLYEPKDDEREKLERYYARRGYPQSDYRIRVRLGLPKGWQSEDTKNYIVIYNTPDQPLVRQIVRDLELIREEYVRLFPALEEFEAVSTVRVCSGRDEYLTFSGLPGSAGYWNWMTEELVLYDATKKEKGEKTDKSDTFIVLYHEAFHQYIHYSSGELSPHSWFNEGYGDYFSGALVTGGRVRGIGLNPWRIKTIQNAIQQRKHVPWSEILRYEQMSYYANPGICYAQGWSMIYFLNTSKHVEKDARLAQILPIYFDTLKATWAKEREQLEAAGDNEDMTKRAEAQLRARVAAVDAAFDGVDVDALEEVWKEFVLGLGEAR